jgi:hypothetical protein
MKTYKVYRHGEYFATVTAETKGEAVTRVANLHCDGVEYGLMAINVGRA